jgi:hypothetical protein
MRQVPTPASRLDRPTQQRVVPMQRVSARPARHRLLRKPLRLSRLFKPPSPRSMRCGWVDMTRLPRLTGTEMH